MADNVSIYGDDQSRCCEVRYFTFSLGTVGN